MAVRIVTDSACDLDQATTDRHGIAVVPLTIRFGDEEFVDREELSVEEFYERMAASDRLPETAAPSPGAFEKAFRNAASGGDQVVCINLSSGVSATMQSAANAGEAVKGDIDVRVVDSRSLTGGLGTIVVAAAEAAAGGASAEEVVGQVEGWAERPRMWGGLNTLENLQKGGRIGKAQALAGTVLSIKPVVDFSTGEVHEAAKPRTRKKQLLWLRDKVAEHGEVEHLNVPHAMADDIDDMLDLLGEVYERSSIQTGYIGPVVGTHAGRGVIGVTFWTAAE
jgi:fatty acid kinase fatty acid binding subunit